MKKNTSQRRIITSLLVLQFSLFLMILGCQKINPPAENITMNPLFTDNMVLQQKQNVPIWGTAESGGEVIVSLNNQQKKGIVDNDGKWKVTLSPVQAGSPYELVIKGKKTHKIKNILVGEVWVCSGQSNMEMPIGGIGKVTNYKEEIANSSYPNIRLLIVEKIMATTPQEEIISDGWEECSPESTPDYSAAAYFFGRDLHKELNVPIGLIQSAYGGTIVETWMSGVTLKKMPDFTKIVEGIESDKTTGKEKEIEKKRKLAEWPDKIEEILVKSGILNHGYQNSDYNTNDLQTMKLPTLWEALDFYIDGVVWFSKNVNVPKSWDGEDLVLTLGKINDYDITWFNGKRVGRGTDVIDLRVYKIPASLVKIGQNRIVVQVLDIGGAGGLYRPVKEMKLSSKNNSISLVGNWKYKVDPIKMDVHKLPEKQDQNAGVNRPTVLFNGMINPLLPYGMRGIIWSQGASNADRSYQYRELFKTMIKDWRRAWGQGDFPFLFTQFANYMKEEFQPVENTWAELREAQTMTLKLPNTGMAVTIDIGEAKDIHPKNKQDVGKRLALNALATVYGKEIPYSGPLYKSMKIEENKIHLQFTNMDKGLRIKGGNKLKEFAIADKDKKFVWAEAKIVGDEVVVSNAQIKNPVAVRYGWIANPQCNLYNGADLPASPFRTDDWKGITYGKK